MRFIFSNTLSPLEYLFLNSTFSYYYPYLFLRQSSLGQGCVVVCDQDHRIDAQKIQIWLDQYFLSTHPQGPIPPPTTIQRVGDQTKKISIQAMLDLDLLG